MLLQLVVPEPRQSLLWSSAFNAGHAPLYGLVALMILRFLQTDGACGNGPCVRVYGLALALTIGAGVMTELIQSVGFGDASAGDVARDAAGATAFLLIAAAFDPRLVRGGLQSSRAIMILGAAVLLTLAFIPLTKMAVAHFRRDAAFPMICGFDAPWEATFVSAQEAEMEARQPPEGWGRNPSDRVARLAFRRGSHPGLTIRKPHPNWTGFQRLVFEVFSELAKPVTLVLRIHDIGHDNDYWDRFNRNLIIEPGANRISIPLREVETAPRGRKMDLSRICGMVLFADHPQEPFVLYLDAFHLE
jgi:hypothetical protein